MSILRLAACLLPLLSPLPAVSLPSDGDVGTAPPTAAAPAETAPTLAPPASQAAFPTSWVGHWRGDAINDDGRASAKRFSMELIIAPTDAPDRFDWTIVYADSSGAVPRQERKYQLIVRNAATGEFAIDERNGIVIESRFLHGALYGHFLVQGTRITTREKLEGIGTADERIEVEMLITRDEPAARSGGAEGVPEVQSWAPRSIQQASLRRAQPSNAATPVAPSTAR